MPKKAYVTWRIAPLQRVIAEPITDPAEQAAIDKVRKRIKRRQGRRKVKAGRNGAKGVSRSAGKKRR